MIVSPLAGNDNTPKWVGRYALYREIARGGMATVHLGRLMGPVGFSRTVAIKRLHPHLIEDQDFVQMFLNEARLAARIVNPNVVSTLDVIDSDNELMLVMEYIQGESLAKLLSMLGARRARIPMRIIGAIASSVLGGLHAAHEAKSEHGEWLQIVHRDISPHNIMIGSDGVIKVLDFGIAKAASNTQMTRAGVFKGKLAYAAPEQLTDAPVDRRVDIYATSVVLWELLAGRRMYAAQNDFELFELVRSGVPEHLSSVAKNLPQGVADVIHRGLARDPYQRFSSAHAMAVALEQVLPQATLREISDWIAQIAGDALAQRAQLVGDVENVPMSTQVPFADVVSETRSIASAPTQLSQRSSQVLTLAFLGAAAVAVVLIVFAVWHFVSAASGASTIVALPSDISSETTSIPALAAKNVAPQPLASASIPGPTTVATPPVALVAVPPPPARAAPTPTPSPPIAPAPTTSKASPPKQANCNPPFFIDSEGIRHAKPECL